jgi:hypothetical protein
MSRVSFDENGCVHRAGAGSSSSRVRRRPEGDVQSWPLDRSMSRMTSGGLEGDSGTLGCLQRPTATRRD